MEYYIRKNPEYENQGVFGRFKRLRKSLNFMKTEEQRNWGVPDKSSSRRRSFFLKFKKFCSFRRRDNVPVCADISEDTKDTSCRNGDIPDYILTNIDISGVEVINGTHKRKRFQPFKFRQTEEPIKECLDVWSEVSSLGGSYHAESPAIHVSFTSYY
jgi:hypothetical protein